MSTNAEPKTNRRRIIIWGSILALIILLIFLLPFLIDEPIRFVLMQRHMYSGRWVRPVTPEGQAALPAFQEKRKQR